MTKASIKLGVGFADNVPRQIVRTNTDRLYVFAAVVQTTRVIKAYWSNPGFPTSAADFPGTAQTSTTSEIISADAVYDGVNIIHVLANDMSNNTRDYPFDISNNTFKTPILISSGTGKPGSYTDIGTTGVSGMFDKLGAMHVAYWTSSNQIMYKSYTYNAGTNTLTQTSGPTRLDSSGNANHPQLVTSPVDNSVTVAWVNGSNGAGTMSARSKPSGGNWASIEQINSGAVWTSPNSGINIDQGPSIVITPDNTRHIIYMENFGSCGTDYGRIHYVKKGQSDTAWTDQSISNFCSHAPGIATNSLNELYIMGHGHPSNPTCTRMVDMCYIKRNTSGSWANPVVFQSPSGSDSLDASASIKWSSVGWNKPEIVEFLFFVANNGSYQNTNLWYGRIAGIINNTSPTPIATLTPTPTQTPPSNTPATATSTPTPQPGGTPITVAYNVSANDRDAWSGTPGGSTKEVKISGFSATEPYDFVSNDVDGEVGGMQFAVSIPNNATITNANLILRGVQFQSPSSTGGFDINLYDVGNTSVFTNKVGSDLSTHHPLYPTSIRWSDPNKWLAGIDYTSSNIASLIQYYIGRSDYAPGNYIGFVFTKGTLLANSYYGWEDFSAGHPPKLSITYTLPTGSTPTPTPKKLGDVDGNGVVDIYDFNEVVGYFGTLQSNPYLDADLDKSGEVDLFDFNEVVANFSLD